MSRKTVVCTNEECSWWGQRAASKAEEAPCPKCSSAVVVGSQPARFESGKAVLAGVQVIADEACPPGTAFLVGDDEAAMVVGLPVAPPGEPAPLAAPPAPVPPRPFTGHFHAELDGVRVGAGARRYLLARQRRGETMAQVAGRTLNELAAGLLDPQGAA